MFYVTQNVYRVEIYIYIYRERERTKRQSGCLCRHPSIFKLHGISPNVDLCPTYLHGISLNLCRHPSIFKL